MPNWNKILDEVREAGSTHDVVRRRYLKQLQEYTGRNTILYYSGWLQKPGLQGVEVNDADKNGFMSVIHNLDRSRGLDLILHTPGGDVAATESLVDYLRSMFGTDIRAVVPQLAMSAGTMIACSTKEILMGKESSLGPVDPQISGIPAHGILEEFERAKADIQADASTIHIWQPIIAKYRPTFIGECEKAVLWAEEMVREWLASGMFANLKTGDAKAAKVAKELSDHAATKNHSRHLSMQRCKEIGLKVAALERDDKLQDLVLSVHHMCIQTLSATGAYKLIENHDGTAFVLMTKQVIVPGN
jgi:hypothetical protein